MPVGRWRRRMGAVRSPSAPPSSRIRAGHGWRSGSVTMGPDRPGAPASDLRPVLHHQAVGKTDRPGADHQPPHRHGAWRHPDLRERRGAGCDLHRSPADTRWPIERVTARRRVMSTILVVDDERLICDLLRSVLAGHGHEVLMAMNGREGLELFKKHRPRFTLLDLRMPEMNGIEVLKQIRAIDPQAAVLILTAWGSDALEQQARQLGVVDFLSKGLSLDVLVDAMERTLQQTAQAASPAQAAAPGGAPQAAPVAAGDGDFILVVDDEPQIRDLLKRFLSLRGYKVRVASDGQQALTMLEQEAPQLIVLDVYMPGINGVEVLRQLRRRKFTGGVILLTGSQDDKLLQEALDLGSVDVMGKPVDLERLALAIQVGCILTEQQGLGSWST